ncbi:MAG: bile acid:sodium symporter family protein [Thermoguttaceae bacterium]|nr:bile acid:sodium symporter family protein [Thermoguttaceae bacterium]
MAFVLERGLLLWLLLLSLAALFWPSLGVSVPDPFVGAKPALDAMIAVTMLAIGSLLPRDEVVQVARRWPTVLGGTAVQYAAMPLLAFSTAWAFGFEGAALVGVTVVGCVPGAMASNVLSLAARANVSYSVSLTTTATLLSPILVPLTLKLTLGQWRAFPAGQVSFNLLLTVVLPVLAGYGLSRWWRGWQQSARLWGPIVANLVILWIIAVVVGLNRERLLVFDPSILTALLLINLGGYLAGNLGGRALRLDRPMRRALTLEVGMQNAGLGTYIVLTVFPNDPAAAIPPALYTFGCMLTGTILARIWAEFGAGQGGGPFEPEGQR